MSDKRECILCDQELPNTQTYDDSIVKKVAVDLFDNCKLRNENKHLEQSLAEHKAVISGLVKHVKTTKYHDGTRTVIDLLTKAKELTNGS